MRRIPKRGFNNRWAKTVLIVNVGDLNKAFKSGDQVTPESLAAANLAKGRYDELKILGNGEVTKKLKVSAHRFSKTATEKITAPAARRSCCQARRRSSSSAQPTGKRSNRRKLVLQSTSAIGRSMNGHAYHLRFTLNRKRRFSP